MLTKADVHCAVHAIPAQSELEEEFDDVRKEAVKESHSPHNVSIQGQCNTELLSVKRIYVMDLYQVDNTYNQCGIMTGSQEIFGKKDACK